MKKLAALLFFFLVTFAAFAQKQKKEDIYMKINNALETFSNVLRAIVISYVVEVDPEVFVSEGINSMLSGLDPYTNYIDENDMDNLDFITNGSYVGLGITVSTKDSMLTVTDYNDFESFSKAGLKLGDRIYKVDSTVVLYKSSDELKNYTRGLPGTKVDLVVLRSANMDTLKLTLVRQDVKVKTVTYSGIISDSIGFIAISNFNRFTQSEFSEALKKLKKEQSLKGLLIDLRNNGGGLVEPAVGICEMFVPENSVIVTTKGRIKSDERIYRSINKPVEPDLPLIILINNETASASEIVAGALQDMDRAVIVGQKSFGKGIVQSVLDMPFKANLKITTAKYYIPSGRCIQKNSYAKKFNRKGLNLHYDSTFYTTNHRPVIESNGITPDSTVKPIEYPEVLLDMVNKDMFFDFATEFSAGLDSLPADFKTDEAVLNKFVKYLDENDYSFKSELEEQLEAIEEIKGEDSLSKSDFNQVKKIMDKYHKSNSYLIKKYSDYAKVLLDIQILQRFANGNDKTYKRAVESDPDVKVGINLLKKSIYDHILSKRN